MSACDRITDTFEERYRRGVGLRARHISAGDLPWANILPVVLAAVPPRGRILDVGSGTGGFACLLASLGYEVTGLERSPAGVALSRRHAAAYGVASAEFIQCDLDAVPELPIIEPADFGFASEILEHVIDHVAVLRKIRASLRPGSYLYATSPSARSPFHRARCLTAGRDWMDEQRQHLRRFTPDTFSAAAQAAGFSVVEVRSIAGLVRDSLYASRLGLRATRFVRRPAVPVVQMLDRVSMLVFESQLLLIARA